MSDICLYTRYDTLLYILYSVKKHFIFGLLKQFAVLSGLTANSTQRENINHKVGIITGLIKRFQLI